MFKSPLLRKLILEVFPAALLSFTGSILVAQYFRPAVVVPPSRDISIHDDLIRAIDRDRGIMLDYMKQAAAMNAVNSLARSPVTLEASGQSSDQKSAGIAGASTARNVQPRPRPRIIAVSAQQFDEPKRQTKLKDDSSSAGNVAIQPPMAILPDPIKPRVEEESGVSVLSLVSYPLERTTSFLKGFKSKVVRQFSITSSADLPTSGRGIY
jgi:hypothetical protein